MTRHIHFVGSIGLESSDAVFSAVGQTLGPYLKRCPDGEVAGRRLWISYQWPVLRATSFLEPSSDRTVPGMGLTTLRVKSGTEPNDIRFGELGYAREARVSYQDFQNAKARGDIAQGSRFQVCLPTPAAVISAFVVPPDIMKGLPAYTQATRREVKHICELIPHADLALQWDVCIEMIQWDGRATIMPPFPGMEVRSARPSRCSPEACRRMSSSVSICAMATWMRSISWSPKIFQRPSSLPTLLATWPGGRELDPYARANRST